jgi:pentatricopeptide repeat protein
VNEGKQIHDLIINKGMMDKDIVLGTALVDMYAKCGMLENAQEILKKMTVQDVVAWNALISGYVQRGKGEEAIECYRQMEHKGYMPNAVTLTCVLKACGITGDIGKGDDIHKEIVNKGMPRDDSVLGTALVDMYAKCGALTKAQQVLEELCVTNVVSWNALISGFAQQGRGLDAVQSFQKMLFKGLCPNSVTFLSVLNACSHSGLVEQGQLYYNDMSRKYSIVPELGHYSCMVDLFGRAGHFDKAMKFIKEMPSCDYPPVWGALLGACQKWGNVELGRFAFDQALQLDINNAAAYACMTNIYAAAGMQEDAREIEEMRMKNALSCQRNGFLQT